MSKLIIVANRLPANVVRKDGRVGLEASVGGLATGLASFYESRGAVWVGWPGTQTSKFTPAEQEEVRALLAARRCFPVFLSGHHIENYYYGFSNKTIWPLFHYFPLYARYEQAYWASYLRVNEKFRDAVLAIAEAGDEIWVHDYHLMLLPALIRARRPRAAIGFFLHIPFPSSELFRLLPWRRELLEGLVGADLVGFHTYGYCHHFINSARNLLGCDYTLGRLEVGNRLVQVDPFPMGIDFEKYAQARELSAVQKELAKLQRKTEGRRIILSVDRLDYSKGIPQRLEAFEAFLNQEARFREKVTLILVAVPSRTAVETYAELKKEVDGLVGRINGDYGSMGWTPILYFFRKLPFDVLTALYNAAEVALVTPLRDGMNLIAKEFIATRRPETPGVLILSEMAGAAGELGDAILVNPNDKAGVARALAAALDMPPDERQARLALMQHRLERYDITRWALDILDETRRAAAEQIHFRETWFDEGARDLLVSSYCKAHARLILLDYDGTLVGYERRPQYAIPDRELLALLAALAAFAGNEVVLVSGRDRHTLEGWVGHLPLALVAEHGAWFKERGGVWTAAAPSRGDWKQEVKSILEPYADRTPGAFVEEKDFSVGWHYRKANPELAALRLRALKEDLVFLTADRGLEMLEGNKVLEIRVAGVNKGRAAEAFLVNRTWDFVMAIGDDRTDEDIFAVLPPSAYSLKVGLGPTRARYNLASIAEVRYLLQTLARHL